MTNRQWLLEQMQNMSDEEFSEYIAQTIHKCKFCLIDSEYECGQKIRCCDDEIANWLKSEHKEPITLSEAERIILESIDKEYKWIARDKSKNLYVYTEKPPKYADVWHNNSCSLELICFNHLFQFVKWKDDEAYNIAELLEGKND